MSLFENAGTKIKSWAFALFVIEAIAAFIGGVVTMFSDDDLFFTGLLVMVVGILAAFITSLFLSAFGELVESTTENKNINAQILEKIEKMEKMEQASAPAASISAGTAARQSAVNGTFPGKSVVNADTWYCTSCGTQNSKNYYQCKKCGKQRAGN